MTTSVFKTSVRTVILSLGLAALIVNVHAQAAKPLLDYRFEKGSGLVVDDKGTANLPLTASPAMGWGTAGTGVAGANTLGRIGDRDVYMENKKADSRGLDGLQSFTVCGWYKARFLERTNGVLLELAAADGLGYRLSLASRHSDAGKIEYSLLSSILPKEVTKTNKGGVQYSYWENQLAVEDEWVFFAAVIDLRDDLRMITYYTGSDKRAPEVLFGSFARPASWAEFASLGKIVSVRMANSVDMKQPVPVGFYFDDVTFFGSAKDAGGALAKSDIQAVWERTLGKKAGSR